MELQPIYNINTCAGTVLMACGVVVSNIIKKKETFQQRAGYLYNIYLYIYINIIIKVGISTSER